MSLEILGQLNWLAVVVAAAVYFALGAVWYMPSSPTGRAWMSAIGFTAHPEGQTPGPALYAMPLATYVLVALVTAWLARALGATTFTGGLVLGLVLWIGYALPAWTLASVFNPHAKEPGALILAQSGYHLIGLLLTGAIVGAWV
jgi:hypothetical protein